MLTLYICRIQLHCFLHEHFSIIHFVIPNFSAKEMIYMKFMIYINGDSILFQHDWHYVCECV